MDTILIIDDRIGGYDIEKNVLAPLDGDVVCLDPSETAKINRIAPEITGLIVNLFPVNGDFIRTLSGCRIISRYGVGYDNVDISAATEQGIWVGNVEDYCVEEASDHAAGLILDSVRGISYRNKRIHDGRWNLQTEWQSRRIRGMVLGIIGYGRIGKALHRKMAGFHFADILIDDPAMKTDEIVCSPGRKTSLAKLLQDSDIITIHAPLNNTTRHLIGEQEFMRMKKGACLVNTARGALVDEKALSAALPRMGCAALDVFETEPLPADSPLRLAPNIILSDHTAYYSEESLVELKTKAAQNVLEVLTGNPPLFPVNRI